MTNRYDNSVDIVWSDPALLHTLIFTVLVTAGNTLQNYSSEIV